MQRKWAGLVAAALLTAASPAGAVVIYDTFGPGSTFQSPRNISIANSPVIRNGVQIATDLDIASRFSTGASAYTLDSVDIALSRVFISPLIGPGDLDVLFYSAGAGGLPGTLLSTLHVTGISTDPTIFRMDFPDEITLTANSTFWVGISAAPPGNEPTGIGWHLGFGSSVTSAERRDNGAWEFHPFSGTPMAMRVNATATALPAPGALLLVVAGLLVVGLRRRAA